MKYKGGISIIIPIYNEQYLLKTEIESLIGKLTYISPYEILLIENGSKDNTYHSALQLSKKYTQIKVIKESHASYGRAVKRGLESARYATVVQFDLDLIDMTFFKKATSLLGSADVIVGSKTLSPLSDKRSFLRMFVTRFVNMILRHYFGYKGTDTHGIKAYRKKSIIPLLKDIENLNLFFDTEVLLLAQKNNLIIRELPVSVTKLRPTRFTMHIVFFQTIGEFLTLMMRRAKYSPNIIPTVTVDDYGLNTLTIRTINVLMKKTRISTVSVLPSLSRRIPHFRNKVACHINLIEGKPVSKAASVPSLVDKNGNFYPFIALYFRLFFNQISFVELEKEIEAQIKSISKYNHIFELNSHQHTHTLYPIDRITDVLAKRHSIPRIRRYGNILHFSLGSYFFKSCIQFIIFLQHLSYGKILSQSPTWKKNEKAISFMSWETSYKSASTPYELVCHPGTKYDRNTMYTSILK